MSTKYLDDSVIGIITENENRFYKDSAFVGNLIIQIGFYMEADKENKANKYNTTYVSASIDNVLCCINTLREDLDEISAEKVLKDLVVRVNQVVGDSYDVDNIFNENSDNVTQPVLLIIKSNDGSVIEDKICKCVAGEINDWMDALLVMKSAKVSAKEKEDYQQEYEKIMGAELIPHKNEEIKDYSTTMSIVSGIVAVISIFFYDMCVFPIIAIVCGGFSGYRCYTNKAYKAMAVCIVAVIIGAIFTYIGWTEFSNSFKLK